MPTENHEKAHRDAPTTAARAAREHDHGGDHDVVETVERQFPDGRVFVKELRRKRRVWAPVGDHRVTSMNAPLARTAGWIAATTVLVMVSYVAGSAVARFLDTEGAKTAAKLAELQMWSSAKLAPDGTISAQKDGRTYKLKPGDENYEKAKAFLESAPPTDGAVRIPKPPPGNMQKPETPEGQPQSWGENPYASTTHR